MLLLVADDEGAEAADEEAGVEAADDDEGDEAEELEGDEELAEEDEERLELPDDDEGAELDEPEPDEEPPADEDEPPSEPPAALTLRGERGRRSVGQRRVQKNMKVGCASRGRGNRRPATASSARWHLRAQSVDEDGRAQQVVSATLRRCLLLSPSRCAEHQTAYSPRRGATVVDSNLVRRSRVTSRVTNGDGHRLAGSEVDGPGDARVAGLREGAERGANVSGGRDTGEVRSLATDPGDASGLASEEDGGRVRREAVLGEGDTGGDEGREGEGYGGVVHLGDGDE